MLITVYNQKGGVGKTSISYSLTKDLDAYYITNDKINSIIPLTIHNKVINNLTKEIIEKEIVVFDSGGFIDKNMETVLKNSHIIFIPLEADQTSLFTLNAIYKEINELNDNIYYIINKVEHDKDFKEIFEEMLKMGISKDRILTIRKSRIFKKVLSDNASINEILKESKLNKYLYNAVYAEYKKLLDLVYIQ